MHCCPQLSTTNAPYDTTSLPSIANVTGYLAAEKPGAWVCCSNSVR